MGSLENKNVVVIGGTSGIGLASAVMAQAEGANVWAASRSDDKVAACSSQHPDIRFSQLDIHDVDGMKSLFESIGTIDHIIAAATGGERVNAPFLEQTHDEWSGAFNKLWGYSHVARQGVPFLTETGSLTFVSGFPARKIRPGMSSIGSTGAAVETMARYLALEIAPKRVNIVAPGLIASGMYDHLPEENRQAMYKSLGEGLPLRRVGESEEVAASIIHAMSNAYMTGATLDVEGGILF